MDYKRRLDQMRAKLADEEIDIMLITTLSNIRYACGFSGSNALLLITPDEHYFYTDFRYKTQIEEEVKGVRKTVYEKDHLEELCKNAVFKNAKRVGFENNLVYGTYQKLAKKFEDIEFVPVKKFVQGISVVKDEEEIANIRKAVEISEQALEEVVALVRPGIKEVELAAELEYRMKKSGGERPSFDPIIISGPRSALVHGKAGNFPLVERGFFTIDFGTVYNGYCSDITRTFMLGEPDEKHKELYEVVHTAHAMAMEAARAGMSTVKLDAVARDYITEQGYGEYFGHSLGHGLGLVVHDSPRVSKNKDSDTELKPGMVITIEPGIYLPDFGGVRIEDDVVITEEGSESISAYPRDLIVL